MVNFELVLNQLMNLMIKINFTALILFFASTLSAQINSKDSTVQVIGYWNLHEKQTYKISEESYQVLNAKDTVKRELYTYVADVVVTDSTANSYTVEWRAHDYKILKSTNRFMEKLLAISDSTPVIVKTNEMGVFQEVVNWEAVRDIIKKGTDMLRKDFKDTIPNFDKLMDQVNGMYASKEAIENSCIEEIQQLFTFHGAKYKIDDEINVPVKLPNNYGGEPIDGDLTVWLDEMNPDEDNCVLRFTQTADAKQLTDAAYTQVNKMMETMKLPVIKREDFPVAMNETRTAARIHGALGWVIYSIQTKETFVNNVMQVKERIIDIQ